MFEHRGSAAPPARVGATGPAGAPGRDGVLDEGFGEDPDADEEVLDRLAAQSALGADLAAYFWTDAFSGKFVVLGLFMIMVGIVSHSARRAGRREQEIINRGRRF